MKSETWRRCLFVGLTGLFLAGCGGSSGAGSGQGGFSTVASIELSPTSATVGIGLNIAITAVARDALGTVLTGVTLDWQSTDSAVASVAAGVVTGIAPGSAAVTASAGGVTSPAVAITVPPPLGGADAPVNTAPPVLSTSSSGGVLTLTTTTGTWTNMPTSYAYRWTRDGATIAGAAQASYVTAAADNGSSVAALVTATNAAGSAIAISNAVLVPSPASSASDPTLGDHGAAFHVSGGTVGASMPAPAMNTWSGSTMLAFVGRGSEFTHSPPFDNKGNTPYVALGPFRAYTKWPGEGTMAYAVASIVGGANHIVSVEDSNRFDEVSFAAIEVRNGGVIQDMRWNEVLNSDLQTSASVTTTGPATLVAAWFGDDASSTPSNAVPNNGFTVIDKVAGAVETVQMFIATRDVSAAGSYNVSWTTTPRQGAQLYLVAVQKR